MIALYFKQFVDPKFLEGISQRNRRRIIKMSLTAALKYWHETILPQHFTVEGQAKYPYGTFVKSKYKRRDQPALVESGEFRDRVLQPPNIRATYKGASIRYPFGRPSGTATKLDSFYAEYRKDPRAMKSQTRNHIFHYMKGKHITFEQAVEQLIKKKYRRLTYSASLKLRMARGIKVFSDEDRRLIREFVDKFVQDSFRKLGKSGYRKLPVMEAA